LNKNEISMTTVEIAEQTGKIQQDYKEYHRFRIMTRGKYE